jgi:hypothetical protein
MELKSRMHSDDGRQQIIVIVRDAAGEGGDGFQLAQLAPQIVLPD